MVDPAELDRLIFERRINKQVHPHLPISIYNYTALAQFKGQWLNAERVCRGLIVADEDNRVIARGPSKFFNYGQVGAPETSLDSLVRVTTKHDGSLGIGWHYDGKFGVATRGSFTSEQAVKAEKLANRLEFPDFLEEIRDTSLDGSTMIFEIIYPENRIVLDYGNEESLRYLGDVDNLSGLIQYRPEEVEVGEVITLRDALELEIPADEEGYVLDVVEPVRKFTGGYYEVTGHVKLKGNEYKILHGLLTNTNARRIWVELAARDCHQWIEHEDDWANKLGHNPVDFSYVKVDQDIAETLLTNVPDEFYDWVTKQIDSINDKVLDLIAQSLILAGQVSIIGDKRARFEAVKGHPMTKEILNHADSTNPEDISKIVLKAWKLAKPAGNETPFKTQEED